MLSIIVNNVVNCKLYRFYQEKNLFVISLLLAAQLVFNSSIGYADSIFFNAQGTNARIISLNRDVIKYTEGCDNSDIKTATWSQVHGITFNPDCSVIPEQVSQYEFPLCESNGLNVFIVGIKENNSIIVAEDVVVTGDRQMHLSTFDPWEQAHGSLDTVKSISTAKICRDTKLSVVKFPQSYCHEPRQVAVGFDYRTPFNNKILTNGFSYTLHITGEAPKSFDVERFSQEVTSAFQAGVLIWVSSMMDKDNLLSPPVRDFIKSRTSTSNDGYRLLTPPQVIRLNCPHNATFVVDLNFEENKLFPKFPLVLAKAQIEGRTIALNMKSFKCFRSELKFDKQKRLNFSLPDGCINLVPILTHELGHAFGIQHIDNPNQPSLMDSIFSREALTPTEQDITAIVLTLGKSITGAAPGTLEFVSSAGVQPPLDWLPTE